MIEDATILFRSLIENFIIYKYYILKKDGTGLSNYFLQISKVRIKDVFEKVIPGYYDSLYSELCKATHSIPLLQAIFRGNVSKDTPIKSNINNIKNYMILIINGLFLGVSKIQVILL